jgi:hypothetical protein
MKSGTGSLLAYTRSCYETRPVSLGFSFLLFCPTGDGSIEDVVQIIREIVQFVARIIARIMFFLNAQFSVVREDVFLTPLVFLFLMTFQHVMMRLLLVKLPLWAKRYFFICVRCRPRKEQRKRHL